MKNKSLIFLVFALLYGANLSAQILKGSSTLFFEEKTQMDAFTPNLPYGAELAFVLEDTTLYRWSRAASSWAEYVSVIDSTRLMQDSILVYYQDGFETGRDTIAGVGGGGSSVIEHDTSAYFHKRLTFGTSYTLPIAALDTSDIVSIYGGALGANVTITLPTVDTTYDGKIIYVRGSATEDGTYIMRVTSTDSSDVLVQGCADVDVTEITPTDSTTISIDLSRQYSNSAGPDTIFTAMGELRMYLISNGKYYRFCNTGPPQSPFGRVYRIDMTTAATTTTVNLSVTNPQQAAIYTFHFLNSDVNEVNFPGEFVDQTGTVWDASTTYTVSSDFFMSCYAFYNGTSWKYNCK